MSAGPEPASPYAPPATASPALRVPVPSAVASGQLRTLGVLHHILGALSLAGAVIFGVILVFGFTQEAAEGFADPVGKATIAVFGVLAIGSLIGGVLCIWSGLHLLRHTRPGLCTTVAALLCPHVPLGTALGIATLVVLQRPDTRALFDAAGARR
ncbi:conserved membrane hypothetical protein [Luteimonas sp. 9C]|uniref:hypothetical protein n=1 Tax=Luteimonas sp. 9C TaxID=2653148 RepID=UPI0012F0BE5E|nr:hypothetical protein [Luteimonas sp. 9C]VXB84771.1 conserved membrane hypothetical protein [Luteimonas sp. 9C]